MPLKVHNIHNCYGPNGKDLFSSSFFPTYLTPPEHCQIKGYKLVFKYIHVNPPALLLSLFHDCRQQRNLTPACH